MTRKIRILRDLDLLETLELPRIGSTWTLIAVTNTGSRWTQPMRILSTHTRYIVARAIPPEGFCLTEEQMIEQRFSKSSHHRIRHDGTTSETDWIVEGLID